MPLASSQDIALNDLELEMFIDLKPYLNPSPYVVTEDASYAKLYTLFRTLGLRHLLVVPRPRAVLGVLTRKDLMDEEVEARQYCAP